MAQYIERDDGRMEKVYEVTDGVPMSALELTGGTSPGHAQRLLDVLAGRMSPRTEEG
jgi:hypothetical protein